MFDIGFWELGLIGVVALFVIGPERMPEMVQTIGQWTGQIRRLITSLKREIEIETRSEEYKLLNKEFLEEDRKFKSVVRDASLNDKPLSRDGESSPAAENREKEIQDL